MNKISPLDLNKKLHIFDGFEPEDYHQQIPLTEDYPELSFTLAEIADQPFKKLRNVLEEDSFQEIASWQKIKNPNTEWETYVGSEDLSLYFFIRPEENSDAKILVLVSFGEFQPARYKVHLEGIWRMENAGDFA